MEQLLPDLPNEIIYQILLRLPFKPLCRFKSVSKPWLALIDDPHFINSLLHHQTIQDNNMTQKLIIACSRSVYSVDYQAPRQNVVRLEMPYKNGKIVASFNGILLLRMSDAELCLWNPSTRMYRKFSQPKYPYGNAIYGIGYDSVSDDFKVVKTIRPSCTDAPCAVHVFTSKLGSWKRIEDLGYCIFCNWLGSNVLNGAPHWIMKRSTNINAFSSNSTTVIVSFDATTEKLKEVPMPNYEGVDNNLIDFGVLGGCLYLAYKGQQGHADVWVMMEYGVKESWTKLFVVPNVPAGEFSFCHLKLLCYTKDGDIVMVVNSKTLVVYNPKQNTFKSITIPKTCEWFDVGFYTESLVSQASWLQWHK